MTSQVKLNYVMYAGPCSQTLHFQYSEWSLIFLKLYMLIINFFVHNCMENKPFWGSDSQSTDK